MKRVIPFEQPMSITCSTRLTTNSKQEVTMLIRGKKGHWLKWSIGFVFLQSQKPSKEASIAMISHVWYVTRSLQRGDVTALMSAAGWGLDPRIKDVCRHTYDFQVLSTRGDSLVWAVREEPTYWLTQSAPDQGCMGDSGGPEHWSHPVSDITENHSRTTEKASFWWPELVRWKK